MTPFFTARIHSLSSKGSLSLSTTGLEILLVAIGCLVQFTEKSAEDTSYFGAQKLASSTIGNLFHFYTPVPILTMYTPRPQASGHTQGVQYACHKSYGTPTEAWMRYETQRLRNFVQRLPWRAPNAPAMPSTPSTRRHPTTSSMNTPRTHQLSTPPSLGHGRRTANTTNTSSRTHQISSARTTSTRTVPVASQPSTPSASRRADHRSTSNATASQRTPRVGTGTGQSRLPSPQSFASAATSHSRSYSTVSSPSSLVYSMPAHLPDGCPIGYVYDGCAVELPYQSILADDDPWHGRAEAYVVFQGAEPGVYREWYVKFYFIVFQLTLFIRVECRSLTMYCLGPIFRGYSSYTEALIAYDDAKALNTVHRLPLIYTQRAT